MKSITKFLLVMMCFAPVAGRAAPVSQTAGSNLTGYNGAMGSVVGNQWNGATNPRGNNQGSGTAKADFGNCNALILRCATPKCNGGGCMDMTVAKSIVTGCVKSNTTCKKHGDALIDAIAAQLVSDSIAEKNKQEAAAAAAQAAADQNNQAMQQQMQQMQQQMMQMQQQSNAQISSLQDALAESQRATNDAVQQAAQAAATTAAQNVQAAAPVISSNPTLTTTEVAAVKSGIDTDVVERGKITGQILTSMQGVDESLDKLKSVMREAFKYGGCNEINGDNCTGPKRVAKFRDLAKRFFEPYEALSDNLDEALRKASSSGVDLGNIYMFFSGACNRWGEYVCRYSTVKYTQDVPQELCVDKTAFETTYDSSHIHTSCGTGEELVTIVDTTYMKLCASTSGLDSLVPQNMKDNCNNSDATERAKYRHIIRTVTSSSTSGLPLYSYMTSCDKGTGKSRPVPGLTKGGYDCSDGQVIPPEDLVGCIMNKVLDATDNEVQEKILNPDQTSSGTIRVGCAPDLGTSLVKRRRSSKKQTGIDIDLLSIIINQSEGGLKFKDKDLRNKPVTNCDGKNIDTPIAACYCAAASGKVNSTISNLKSAIVKKSLDSKCCNELGIGNCDIDCYDLGQDVAYVHPDFALCDTHAWNAGYETNEDALKDSDTKSKTKEVIGLKTTFITQQMYKQYTTMSNIIKQLKVMLEKEALKAELQIASGNGDDDSGSGTSVQFATCSKVDAEAALTCLRDNYSKLQPFVTKGNNRTDVKRQLASDASVLDVLLGPTTDYSSKCSNVSGKTGMQNCLNQIASGINKLNDQVQKSKRAGNGGGGFYIQPMGMGN